MTDVFNDKGETPPKIDETKNYLEDLVGEGKKFKTPEELARGKWESDQFISSLTREMEDLRKEILTRKTTEELLDQIAQRTNASAQSREPLDEDSTRRIETPQVPGLKKEDVEKLVAERLQQTELQRTATQNLKEVNDTLEKKWGAEAVQRVKQKAADLGVSLEYLQNQAKVSPKAFYALIGVETGRAPAPSVNVPISTTNTSSNLQGDEVRNEAWYKRQVQKDPSLKLDKKFQIQKHKDALRLGRQFFE